MQTTLTLTHLRLLLRAPSRWRQGLSVLLCIVVLSSSSFAQGSKADADELKLVVALFRHGVRSPEADFDQEEADKHSKNKWPDLPAWNVMGKDCENAGKTAEGWGYLTKHGQQIATGLGTYYGNYYKQGPWSGGFQKVYFWADAENQRTRETAAALANGFRAAGIPDVKVDSLTPCTRDLLFHPFEAECGTPDPRKFADIASYIASNWKTTWTKKYKAQFDQLFRTLGCSADDCATCDISHCFTDADTVTSWKLGAPRTSPIKWTGRFSYASSASEAFLLEYANNMQVGWGNVDAGGLRKMLFLHEFFFDQTERQPYIERQPYLALVLGSNLVNEIFNVIHLKATGDKSGCPHAPPDSQFVGLVGHDTNLANVQALLGLRWEFDDPKLPDDTKGLPANDALPAGALVFELRKRNQGWFVRIEYVTQSLSQMRNGPVNDAFRLRVKSPDCIQAGNFCEMSLPTFNNRVMQSIGKDKKFLSHCSGGTQTCSQVVPTPIRNKSRR